jgi:hypothetical protein
MGALPITWQETRIYNLLGKEEAKVGNDNTVCILFIDTFFPPFCTQNTSYSPREKAKSSIEYGVKLNPRFL